MRRVIIFKRSVENPTYGGIAQLARAIGSYPIGRGFKSNFRYQDSPACIRPDGQAVKTPPFHGSNGGSIPPRVSPQENCFYGPMVKRLRHRPFTAVTGVRFPLGSSAQTNHFVWPDGQAVKTPPFHGSNGGSIPPRVIKNSFSDICMRKKSFFLLYCTRLKTGIFSVLTFIHPESTGSSVK